MCDGMNLSPNNKVEVDKMPSAHKPSEYGRNDDRLEQISRHPVSDPMEELLVKLSQYSTSADTPCDELSFLDDAFARLEANSPVQEVAQEDIECRLKMLHDQYPELSKRQNNATAVANQTKLNLTKGEIEATEESVSPRKHFRTARKIALIAAVLILIISAVAVPAFGNIFEMFAQWTSQIFHMDIAQEATIGHNDMVIGESRTYDTPEEMLADFDIRGQLLPTWIPDGFELAECKASCMTTGLLLESVYATSTVRLYFKYIQTNFKNSIDIEKGTENVTLRKWGNIQHYQITDGNLEKIMWVNGEFSCQVAGNISSEDIQKIVASIYGNHR